MSISIVVADYSNSQHKRDIPYLLNAYACDPMGGGKPLEKNVQQHLVSRLASLPHAFSILAYVDDEPAGLTNCFEGFSTFSCKPLVNVHDLVVLPEYRGKGLSIAMLQAVENVAIEKGCCKVTLEVLSNNEIAKAAYLKFGFSGYELDPEVGQALFWQKTLKD